MRRLVLVSGLVLSLAFGLWLLSAPFAPRALAITSCAQVLGDANLISNGMMGPGGSSPYGPVANDWNAFIMAGDPPHFDWVDNEGIDPEGSQYIWADAQPFDAGIYQVVGNLQPGMYYRVWIGYAQRRYDPGDTVNHVGDQVGAMVGADPTGGTDPHSPNVRWSGELLSGSSLNSTTLDGVISAQGPRMTVFVRGLNHMNQYRAKLWFDSICMQARPDLPTATPVATNTFTPAPTNTPRVVAAAPRLAATAVPTEPPPTDTPTETPPPTNTPTSTPTRTITPTPTETARPRRAIPSGASTTGGATASTVSDLTGASPNQSDHQSPMSMVVLLGSIGLAGVSLVGMISLGAFLLLRVVKRQTGSDQARYS